MEHGGPIIERYGDLIRGPTLGRLTLGRGYVMVFGYMGDFSSVFKSLQYVEEKSTLTMNVERLVFHQELVLDINHTEGLGPCPVVLAPEQNKVVIDPAFVHLLATTGDGSKGPQYLAEVIFHSALHLYIKTSP